VGAPAGALWSELPTGVSSVQGFLVDGDAGASVADGFLITDPQGWVITEAVVYAYQPGSAETEQPLSGASARLWQGQPGESLSRVVWETDAALAGASFAGVYRADSRGQLTRPLLEAHLKINVALGPGRYWLEWSARGRRGSGVWTPAVTVWGVRGPQGSDSVQQVGGVWAPMVEPALGDGVPAAAQAAPMVLRGYVAGTSPTCYPNCDASAATPFLSAQDFSCFMVRFAQGSPYANCDGSTSPPVLNVSDMQCFLGAFTAGCSAP
jgi:hypothetical protein